MEGGAHHLQHMLQHKPVELVAAAVLSAAGVLTSWSSYQSSLWDGVQLVHYSRAGAHRLQASHAALDASLTRAVEVSLFRAWVEAKSQGDERLAGFYQARFPKDLAGSFPAWLAQQPFRNPSAEPSPFTLPSYRPRGRSLAGVLEGKAEHEFRAAIEAKHTADVYERAAVVLASAMFFGGIGQAFEDKRLRVALTIFAVLSLVAGAVMTLSLPKLGAGMF